MQTFLTHPDIKYSLSVLDYKRLGKQRVEAYQIISAITGRLKLDGTPYKGWTNHPCSVMWRDYVPLLKTYYNESIIEWIGRGYKNTMKLEEVTEPIVYPNWFGDKKFHASHRANLLKKDKSFYSKYGWDENPTLPYCWMDDKGDWYEQQSGTKERVYYEKIKL
jgi:hypothetical protein